MELRTLVIGKIYTPSTLGYYNRGQQFPKVIVSNIDGSIQSVMLPTLSAHQENKKRVKEMMRRAIISSSLLIFPMMIGMAVVAESLVKIILTDNWLPAVPFLQIFCLSFALWPIHTANLQAINALGKSNIFLKLEIVKKIVGIIILGASLPFGIYAIALGEVLSGLISSFINAYPNKLLLDYSYKEQWADITPSLLITVVMGGIVYLVKFLNLLAWQTLIVQITVGICIYIGLAKIFKIESFEYLVRSIIELMNEKKMNRMREG
jgi:O-antigen/teichoic acid export membrane protein